MNLLMFVFVFAGFAGWCYVAGRQDERLARVCELCDGGNALAEHLGMCVECYEFYHVDG